MAKIRVNISVTPDTAERLKQCAYERHTTVSQLITDWIWKEKVSGAQLRGQRSLDLRKREGERANENNRVILALPKEYEELPGSMCREVAADMFAHAIGRGGCDEVDFDDYIQYMEKDYPPGTQFFTLEYNSAKEWGLVD